MGIKTLDPLSELFHFKWDTFDVIVSGKSAIDSLTSLDINSKAEAEAFSASYGYLLEDPIENAEILGCFREAVAFIRKYFLAPENSEGLSLEVPKKIAEIMDVRDLLLYSSFGYPGQSRDTQGQNLKHWACSILKVMHTIAHIDKDLRSPYFSDIQQQIFDRFYKVVQRDSNEQLYLGENPNDPLRVNLVAFDTKPKKARNSILLKLLHKPENVAEDIFDRVGLRFITESPVDCLRIVKFLKDRMLVMPPNIKPSRSRNSLIDLDSFKSEATELQNSYLKEEIDAKTFLSNIHESCRPPSSDPSNPHSSEFYRAIQFTCRQLIKLKNPLYNDLRELKNLSKAKRPENDEIQRVLERMDLKHIQREVRFFYPFEIQLMDKKSAEDNEKGRSAHSEYKKAQVQTALRRVMGPLVAE